VALYSKYTRALNFENLYHVTDDLRPFLVLLLLVTVCDLVIGRAYHISNTLAAH
jgi:hypothetical protein